MKEVAKSSKSAKGFQVTCNEEEKFGDVLNYLRSLKPNYLCAAKEKAPSTGHVHMHAYVQFPNARRLSIKKLLGSHLEKCFGSPEQNEAYIKKDGEIIAEEGTIRTCTSWSIKGIKEMSKEDREELPPQLYNIVQKINQEEEADLTPSECFKEVEVHWYWGESGIGKTRMAMKNIGERKFNMVKYENGFWHGVGNAEIALYDDFRDTHMKPTELINFIDYYIHPMNIKGGSKKNIYKEIYITSIQDPEKIYSNMPEEYKRQWLRRLKSITLLEPESNSTRNAQAQ